MTIYILGWAYFSFFLLLSSWKSEKKRIFFLVGTFILVLYIYGMRSYDVGTDTMAYTRYFEIYTQYSFSDLIHNGHYFKSMEPGFIVLCKIIIYFTDEVHAFLPIVALLYGALYVLFLANLKEEEVYWYAFAYYGLYIFCTGLNILRQGLAMLFLLHAYLAYMKDKRKWIVVFWVVVAYMFHKGSLLGAAILLPFAIMKEKIVVSKFLKWIIISSTIFGLFLVQEVFQIFGIEGYLDGKLGEIGYTRLAMMIVLLMILYISKGYYRKTLRLSEFFFIETNLIILILMNFMSRYSPVFIRLTTLLLVFSALVPIRISKCNMSTSEKILIYIISYLAFTFYFYHSLIANTGGIVPFVLENY